MGQKGNKIKKYNWDSKGIKELYKSQKHVVCKCIFVKAFIDSPAFCLSGCKNEAKAKPVSIEFLKIVCISEFENLIIN